MQSSRASLLSAGPLRASFDNRLSVSGRGGDFPGSFRPVSLAMDVDVARQVDNSISDGVYSDTQGDRSLDDGAIQHKLYLLYQ